MAKINVNGFTVVAQVRKIPLHLLDNADFNPKGRSNEESAKIQKLAKSISEQGQHVPIHVMVNKVGNRLTIEEGHGRTTAQHIVGNDFVNGIIHPYSENSASKYQAINDCVNKHTNADRLEAYLHTPMTCCIQWRGKFAKMIGLIGRDLAVEMVEKGKGWSFYNNRCLAAAKWVSLIRSTEYVTEEQKSNLKKFITWNFEEAVESNVRKLWEKRHEHCEGMSEVLRAFYAKRTPNCC